MSVSPEEIVQKKEPSTIFLITDLKQKSELTLPFDSIYGIACIGPAEFETGSLSCEACGKDSIKSFFMFWIMVAQNYLLLVINYGVQMLMIKLFMDNANNTFGEIESCQSSYYVRGVCMCLFLTTCYGDIEQSIMMLEWHYRVKTELKVKMIKVEDPHGDDPKLMVGLSFMHKIFNVVFIILPKLTIGIGVFIYGSTFIALSENNEDAFLNTLAGYFILEIDELLYKSFISPIIATGASLIPPLKKYDASDPNGRRSGVSEPWAICSLLCCNLFLMTAMLGIALIINGWACVEQFERLPPTSNASCNVLDSIDSALKSTWIQSTNCTSNLKIKNATSRCQQHYIALTIQSPLDFPKVTGCMDECETTYALIDQSQHLMDYYMASMVFETIAMCFICCIVLAGIGEKEFVGISSTVVWCMTTIDIILHTLGLTSAYLMNGIMNTINDDLCIDSESDMGREILKKFQMMTSSINTSIDLGIAVLLISGIEILFSCMLYCSKSSEDRRVFSGLCVLCFQLTLTVLTCVAFGAGGGHVGQVTKDLFEMNDNYNYNSNTIDSGWCTSMTNTTRLCINNLRGPGYFSSSDIGLLGPNSGTL